jgi:uncharacterized protein
MQILNILLGILVTLFILAFAWLVVMKIIARILVRFERSAPCPASFSWLVDNPLRKWANRKVLERVGIQRGEQVLELGPGPGVFTVPAARDAGAEGKVISIDIQEKMIRQVRRRVEEAGVTNVETHVAGAYALPLQAGSMDRAFVIAVLAEIEDQPRALGELYRVLKPGGVLSISEEFFDPDYPFISETIRRTETAGFKLVQRYGNFWGYTVNFQK